MGETEKPLPDFVERPQDLLFAPPFVLGRAHQDWGFQSHGFWIEIDHVDALARLCDRYLNRPLRRTTPPRFVPSAPAIVVTINRYKYTGDPAATRRLTSIPYLEVCFLVQVHDTASPAGQEPYWFMPLVHIAPYRPSAGDTSFAPRGDDASLHPVMTGREAYGFPKEPSRVTYDVAGTELALARLEILVQTSSEELTYAEVLRIEPETAHRENDARPPATDAPLPSARALRFDRVGVYDAPLLTLKQFRDPRQPTKACYQAVVATPLDVMNQNGFVELEADYLVSFRDPGHQGLWTELGLEVGQQWRTRRIPALSGAYCLNSWLRFGDPARTRVWPCTG